MTPTPERGARPFWPSCGYAALQPGADGGLAVSDAFLRLFYHRPELAIITESCAAERALHASLLERPRRAVGASELAALADPDARENYQVALAFRDLLLRHATLERAYMAIVSGHESVAVTAFVDWLVQLIVCRCLAGSDDAYRLRAAELLFRPQRVSLEHGVMLADAARVARSQPQSLGALQALIRQAGGVPADSREMLQLLNQDTLEQYWQRSETHEFVLSLNHDQAGIQALCRVLEAWLGHFHRLAARITPLRRIDDLHWRWHIGLDANSNRLLNELYRGATPDAAQQRQLLALFKLEITTPDAQALRPELAGRSIYLGLAMDERYELRLKPQNILLNLPLAAAA